MSNVNHLIRQVSLLFKSNCPQPPGPPPRPGLVWNPQTCRWVRPKTSSVGRNTPPQNETATLNPTRGKPFPDEGIRKALQKQLTETLPRSRGYQAGQHVSGKGLSDEWLRAYATELWGTQEVQIVSGKEFDAIESPHNIPTATRGVDNVFHLDSNLNDGWMGVGKFGNGQYHSVEPGAMYGKPNGFGGGGWTYAAKLHPEAKVAAGETINEARKQAYSHKQRDKSLPENFLEDAGRLMADMGYDAGYFGHELVVYNKRALIVDERSLPGGEIEQKFNAAVESLPQENRETLNEYQGLLTAARKKESEILSQAMKAHQAGNKEQASEIASKRWGVYDDSKEFAGRNEGVKEAYSNFVEQIGNIWTELFSEYYPDQKERPPEPVRRSGWSSNG